VGVWVWVCLLNSDKVGEYIQLGQLEDAADCLRSLCDRFQDHEGFVLRLSKVFRSMGQTGAAWDVLNDFLDRHPSAEDTHYEMGELSQLAGNHSAALSHFGSHVVQHGKLSVEAMSAMGMIHFQMGALGEAEEFFRLVLKHRPNSLAAQSNLAVILERRGQTQDAIVILRNAISAHPTHPALRRSLKSPLSFIASVGL
jgi:predicted Zn-dependent protease